MHAKCMVQTACCLGKSKENLEKLKEKEEKLSQIHANRVVQTSCGVRKNKAK